MIKTGIFILLLGLLASPVLLLYAVSADTATVEISKTVDSNAAARVKRIARQVEYSTHFNHLWTLAISQQDLDGILALGARAVQRIEAAGNISAEDGTTLTFSLHIPENPLGQFINIKLTTAPNSDGISIRQLDIGQLSLGEQTARTIIEMGMGYVLGKQQSSLLLNSIKTIRTRGNKLLIQYQPIPDLGKIVARGLNQSGLFGGDLKTLATPEAIQFHYQQLCQQYHAARKASLAHYLAARFTAAAQRSNNSQQALAENRAALVALAIFFGSYKFNTILNAIPAEEIDRCQYPRPKSQLAGRRDLSLHFIYSAMIKIMSDNDISFTMGEFKELSDALRGGSGFSFADLAADQAGIQFAAFATQPDTARQLHKNAELLSDEASFFPDLAQLSEGISQQQFEQQYGGVEGENYIKLVNEIRARIHRLGMYQAQP